MSIYTIVLDVNGGTYVDQSSGASALKAVMNWSKNPHPAVLTAFNSADNEDLRRAIDSNISDGIELLIPISGLQSVWFLHLEVNEIGGFMNVIKTEVH